MRFVWGIWCKVTGDWLRELPSKVRGGGTAILAFERVSDAKERAAAHYHFATYTEASRAGWCEVRAIGGPAAMGSEGGKAAAKRMTPEQRAKKAAAPRWGGKP